MMCKYFTVSIYIYIYIGGLGSLVGIATYYGLNGPGSNPGGGRDFTPVQTGPGAPVKWVPGFSRG